MNADTHQHPFRATVRRTWASLLTVLVITAGAAAANLQVSIEHAIGREQIDGATVAVSVREIGRSAALVEIEADRPMIVASNMKLLTTGATLHVLGEDFAFRTSMRWDGSRLVIKGDGDPAFGDPELLELMGGGGKPGLDIEQFIEIWVDAVTDADITRIEEVIVDDRIFDRQFFHPSWPIDQLNRRYCAEVGGMNVHLNVLHVYPAPRPGGRPDIRIIRPEAPWITFTNRATSATSAEDSNTAWISRPADSNDMTLYGNVKHAYSPGFAVPITIHDPPQFFADLMRDRLRDAGIDVGSARVAGRSEELPEGKVIGPVVTTPISTIITRCNRDSENLYAEAMLKRLGHELTGEPGSWTNGAAVIRHVVLDRLRDPAAVARLVVSDGSGLSRDNRVTAQTFTAWLSSFAEDDTLGPVFLDSLATAGKNGTLAKRFRDVDLHGADVRGKSGYINSVSTLSGYVIMPDGNERAFSILINGFKRGSLWKAKRLQERIVALIAEHMAESVEITLGSD